MSKAVRFVFRTDGPEFRCEGQTMRNVYEEADLCDNCEDREDVNHARHEEGN